MSVLNICRFSGPLSKLSGVAHGADGCDASGEVVLLRKDVGRHNPLDKLIGALQRSTFGDGMNSVAKQAVQELAS